MRFEHTPALTFAMQRAAGYARRAGADAVAPLHLLLGLLADEEGQPATLLAAAGVARPDLCARLGLIEGASPDAQEMPLDADSRAVMSRTRELAMVHAAEGTLSTDQVLLALVEECHDVREKLSQLGLDASRLCAHVE